MSRSRKKTPITTVAVCNHGAMKKWKRMCSRKVRRGEAYNNGWFKKAEDPWTGPSDGKCLIDPKSKWMRK